MRVPAVRACTGQIVDAIPSLVANSLQTACSPWCHPSYCSHPASKHQGEHACVPSWLWCANVHLTANVHLPPHACDPAPCASALALSASSHVTLPERRLQHLQARARQQAAATIT